MSALKQTENEEDRHEATVSEYERAQRIIEEYDLDSAHYWPSDLSNWPDREYPTYPSDSDNHADYYLRAPPRRRGGQRE